MMNEMMWREIINNENKELFKEFLYEADNFVLSIDGDVQVKNYIEIEKIINNCDVVYVGVDENERFHIVIDEINATVEIL